MAMVSSAFAQNQPQGTWYLGHTDAAEALNLFSTGVPMESSIGYAVSDNFVLSLEIGSNSTDVDATGEYFDESYVQTISFDSAGTPFLDSAQVGLVSYNENTVTRTTNFALSAQYFFGDNYYVGGGINSSTYSMTVDSDLDANDAEEDMNTLGLHLRAGKFIPVRENWYLSPEVRLRTSSTDGSSSSDLGFRIGLGLRF